VVTKGLDLLGLFKKLERDTGSVKEDGHEETAEASAHDQDVEFTRGINSIRGRGHLLARATLNSGGEWRVTRWR